MFRTFDVLNGDVSNEQAAGAIAEVAEPSAPELDLAALVARFNDIDARINKIESQLNDAFKSQVEATSDAVDASAENAEDDDPGTVNTDEPAEDAGEKENNDEG